jgi:hypothetical protein
VNGFLAFAFRNSAVGDKILCPCRKCVNLFWREASDIREHLICDGFIQGYTTWNLHGEESTYYENHGNNDMLVLWKSLLKKMIYLNCLGI